MSGSIKICENFFTEEILTAIQKRYDELFSGDVSNFSSNQTWPYVIRLDSAPVLIYNIHGAEFEMISELVQKYTGNSPTSIMYYLWTPMSHIGWHDDSKHKGALTVYLNDEWNINHGGVFLYQLNDRIEGIYPKRNLAVHQIGTVPHTVTPLSRKSNNRKTIQIFY